jgi:NAD(P) transhydrogenase beta subunit/Alanine dehydrogenase/PNT, N-terminal domain
MPPGALDRATPIVGVPAETRQGERRVALVPTAVTQLTKAGLDVTVERGVGERAGFSRRGLRLAWRERRYSSRGAPRRHRDPRPRLGREYRRRRRRRGGPPARSSLGSPIRYSIRWWRSAPPNATSSPPRWSSCRALRVHRPLTPVIAGHDHRYKDELPHTDVVLVIGANDVVNPAARSDRLSPIYGMPILDVDRAAAVVVVIRSMRSGFAGVDNELFYLARTQMLFGDAKAVVGELVGELLRLAKSKAA